MNTLPTWLAGFAALDDDALAALANRGLVRRAAREVARVSLASAGDAEVALRHDGTPPATVRLGPGGPGAARCDCPVAGVCVHVVAACLWAREHPPDAAGPDTPAADSPPAAGASALADVLTWDPAACLKAAGVAAARRVARGPVAGSGTEIRETDAAVHVRWAGSPDVVALPGLGLPGMLVSGTHGDVAERAWKLEALVRLFAAHGRAWPWPDAGTGGVPEGQREAMHLVADVVGATVRGGLAHARPDTAARLEGAAQRARVEALPLLARLVGAASGRVGRLARRDDDTTEGAALAALADAWALARALLAADAPLPPALVGGAPTDAGDAGVGTLVPLSVRWWVAASGARGLTATFWDDDRARLETVTTGRAGGSDPSFVRSWTIPLLWGASPETLCRGPLRLVGAERRDDGTLAPTSRTSVEPLGSWEGVDLDSLARWVAASSHGPDAVGFGRAPPPVRIIRPRRPGLGALTVDEVAQQTVWPVRDTAGVLHVLRMDTHGREAEALTQVLVRRLPVAALVVSGDRPDAAFLEEGGGVRLVSLTLTPFPWQKVSKRRDAKVRDQRAATAEGPPPPPLAQLCDAVLDGCEALAATGRPTLSPQHADAVARRAEEAASLGLGTLAAAARALTADPVAPDAVLRAAFVAHRVRALAVATT